MPVYVETTTFLKKKAEKESLYLCLCAYVLYVCPLVVLCHINPIPEKEA